LTNGWTTSGVGGALVSPYEDFATPDAKGGYVRNGSWYGIQSKTSGTNYFPLRCPLGTLPTNIGFIARFAAHTGGIIGLGVTADTAGSPDIDNRFQVVTHRHSGTIFSADAGSATSGSFATFGTAAAACEYAAIHKVDTSYHAWVGTSGGTWFYLGAVSIAWTPTWVAILPYDDGTIVGRRPLVAVDFVRSFAGVFPPWL